MVDTKRQGRISPSALMRIEAPKNFPTSQGTIDGIS